VRKGRTNLELAISELEDRQKRVAHKEARAAELESQVCWPGLAGGYVVLCRQLMGDRLASRPAQMCQLCAVSCS
jgi:hypothetical protein